MLDTPLEIRQLANMAWSDLGLSRDDAVKLETYMIKAYTAGMKAAHKIWEEACERDKQPTEPGSN